ncbi:hypothetical protein ES705_46840 [subsurface metagenome]
MVKGESPSVSKDLPSVSKDLPSNRMDSRNLSKRANQDRGNFYMELSRKEIDGLELENWYRAVMWNYGKFGMDYIEKTIKEYDYDTRMSCWYIYADSGNIRNKEAFFSHLLRNYREEEKL